MSSVHIALCIIVSCTFLDYTNSYDAGKVYKYKYETSVDLSDGAAATKNSVGFQLSTEVEVTKLWSQPASKEYLLRIQVNDLKLSDRSSTKSSVLKTVNNVPCLAHLKDGDFVGIYISDESATVKNLYRGLASMLVSRTSDWSGLETDVSGTCHTTYKSEKNKIVRIKSGCLGSFVGSYTHTNQILSAVIDNSKLLEYSFDDNKAIIEVMSNELHLLKPAVFTDVVTQVKSRSSLKLIRESSVESKVKGSNSEEIINSVITALGIKVNKHNIVAEEGGEANQSKPSLKKSVSEYKRHLRTSNLASTDSAKAFVSLLKIFRSSTEAEMLDMLKKYKKITPQLIDILAVTQTKASYDAATKYLKFESTDENQADVDLVERYLVSVAVSSHPDGYCLQKLLALCKKKLRNENIFKSLLLTLGATVKSVTSRNVDEKDVEDAVNYLVESVSSCKNDDCRQKFIKALVNSASSGTVALLEEYIRKGNKVSVTALRALHRMDKKHITEGMKRLLENVYFQITKRYDSSARILAVDILLKSDPEQDFIECLIKSFANQQAEEVSTYLSRRVMELTDQDPKLKQMVRKALAKQSVGNYNTLAQKGLSVAMSNPLFVTKDIDVLYGMHTELLKGGMLKSTSFDVDVSLGSKNIRLISVGAFATGLDGFVGESSTSGDEGEATCGMQISVLGVDLRPYIFFTGQSELMSLVWSGAGSEPTPALQGNLLLHDHLSYVILNNGVIVRNSITGVVSTDLSGSVQISLWNRNAESNVENKGALLLRCEMMVATDFGTLGLQYDVDSAASLNFKTTLDFYNTPFRMCMEMDQPPFILRHNITRAKNIPSIKRNIQKTVSDATEVQGRSYALPQAIYKACASLKS